MSSETRGDNDEHVVCTEPALRKSMFIGVPPYINYVPNGGFTGEVALGPQYWDEENWDQDQLWRFTLAMSRWIDECAVSEAKGSVADWEVTNNCLEMTHSQISGLGRKQVRSKRQSLVIGHPFEQRSDDAKKFTYLHPGVKLSQFPKMRQISRKDLLGKHFSKMQKLYGIAEFGFHPLTYVIPEDMAALQKAMKASEDPENDLWIVKPPNQNNGHGIHVINGQQTIDPDKLCCVQRYIRNPLLIYGLKFDIRIYVLLTSLEPLKIYMYNDGLVRIATELYTEDPESISDACIHVTNYDVNRRNTEKFIHNYEPGSCAGHKWRLQVLWNHLRERGYDESSLESIHRQIEDVVVKSILVALPEMRQDFREIADLSTYNSYKLLGYDMMIDNDLKVHMLEVNGRPQLQSAILDKAVNRPMLAEVLKIVGFHIPKSVAPSPNHRQFICDKFNLGKEYGTDGDTLKHPVCYQAKIYSRVNIEEDNLKQLQKKFKENVTARDTYLKPILEELTPTDVRALIKAEEELAQCKRFKRLFPSQNSHTYFQYFCTGIPYYDKLLDAWEHHYGGPNRSRGIKKLKKLCSIGAHL